MYDIFKEKEGWYIKTSDRVTRSRGDTESGKVLTSPVNYNRFDSLTYSALVVPKEFT